MRGGVGGGGNGQRPMHPRQANMWQCAVLVNPCSSKKIEQPHTPAPPAWPLPAASAAPSTPPAPPPPPKCRLLRTSEEQGTPAWKERARCCGCRAMRVAGCIQNWHEALPHTCNLGAAQRHVGPQGLHHALCQHTAAFVGQQQVQHLRSQGGMAGWDKYIAFPALSASRHLLDQQQVQHLRSHVEKRGQQGADQLYCSWEW